MEFIFSFRNLRESWKVSAVWQSCQGWRLLPLPSCGTGVPGSKSHNPWHFGNSEGFEFLMQSQGSLLVVISVPTSSLVSTFGRSAWRCRDDQSWEGRREVCTFPSRLQGIIAGFGVTVSLTGLEKVPTSSSLPWKTGLEPWLLGLGGGFSLRLQEFHLFSPKRHLFLLSPTQVTWL